MSTNNSLVSLDLKSVSKVGIVLIEKVSAAIGGLYKPYQVVQMAKAQVKAEIIEAEGQIKVEELKHRALDRFISEEIKKQANIESITGKAIPLLENTADAEQLEDDWVSNFFDKCRITSDSDMQQLWAKVLAGEVNSPGKFSKRTINLLSDLDKSDAELFQTFCGFCWMIGTITPLIFEVTSDVYSKNGINFNRIMHLESLGLVQYSGAISRFMRSGLPDKFIISYYGQPLSLKKLPEAGNEFTTGQVNLTNAGMQLAEICGSKPVQGFFDYVVDYYKQNHYSPT